MELSQRTHGKMHPNYFSSLISPALDSLYLQNWPPVTYNNGINYHHHQITHQSAVFRSRTLSNCETADARQSQAAAATHVPETRKYHPLTTGRLQIGDASNSVKNEMQDTGHMKIYDDKLNQVNVNSETVLMQTAVSENNMKVKKKLLVLKPAEIITHDENQKSIINSPAYFLGLFLDLDVINWLTIEASENCKDQKSFVVPTEEEMRCFVAILYLSGYVDVPRRRMLWERSPDTHCSLVSNAMQRDRFESIFTSLHAGDTLKGDVERLNQIQSLVDLLNVKFLVNCPMDDQHSIAENTISSSVRHHNAKASAKFAKVWCGCTKVGYCLYFSPLQSNNLKLDGTSVGKSIILHYARILYHYNPLMYSLTCEDIYMEPHLIEELRKLGIQAVGARRENNSCLLNSTLGGIDRLKCNLNLYRTLIKGRKSYSTLLTFCLDLMMNNAWHLHKSSAATQGRKPLDLLGFRRSIVVYYLEHYAKPISGHKGGRSCKTKPKGKRHPASDARYDGIRHYVVPQEKQTRCGKCTAKTTTRCQKCDVGVHVKCFVDFHTKNRDS